MATACPTEVAPDRPAPPIERLRQSPARYEALDVARLVASLAIIWIHAAAASGTTVLARFAVPFFTCVAVLFVVEKARREPLSRWPGWARSRAARLYLPFLAWSAVYLGFKLVKKAIAPEQANDFGGWEMLVWGGAYHLWFLPFILVVSLAAFPLASLAAGNRELRLSAAVLLIMAAVAIACLPCPFPAGWGESAACIWNALPAAAAGGAWGLLARRSPARGGSSRWGALAGGVLWAVSLAALAVLGRCALLETAAGLGLAWLALGSRSLKFPPLLVSLGQLAYGIYCSHLLFIKIAESVAGKLRLEPTLGLEIASFVLAAIGSAACAWWLSRYRATRWLVA
jgi:peptidoglycan/LPS O-acetylase OafA/YrhL